jgi:hypothetical protein
VISFRRGTKAYYLAASSRSFDSSITILTANQCIYLSGRKEILKAFRDKPMIVTCKEALPEEENKK